MDLDQIELDAAYDQSAYAPLFRQTLKRFASNSDDVRARLGMPGRLAYGPTSVEALDLYPAKKTNSPIFVFIHGGAWRAEQAKDMATQPSFSSTPGLITSRLILLRSARRTVTLASWQSKCGVELPGPTRMPRVSGAMPTDSTSAAIRRVVTYAASRW